MAKVLKLQTKTYVTAEKIGFFFLQSHPFGNLFGSAIKRCYGQLWSVGRMENKLEEAFTKQSVRLHTTLIAIIQKL